MLDSLMAQPWWTYDPATAGVWGHLYRWFNLVEGAIWLVLAGIVFQRWWRNRRSNLEWIYGAALFAFGLTDFREASVQSAALVLVKAVNLAALLLLRWQVMTRCSPDSRIL